jgi:hypothetical protein
MAFNPGFLVQGSQGSAYLIARGDVGPTNWLECFLSYRNQQRALIVAQVLQFREGRE